MFEKVYRGFDKVKATPQAVEKAVESAMKADEDTVVFKNAKFYSRKITVSVMAACLALVFVCTLVFGLRYNPSDGVLSTSDYSFCIKANASQVSHLVDVPDKSVIGVYSSEQAGGWAMFQNFEIDADVSPTYFQSYCLNYLNIEGRGIESIKFKANGEGTYFAISPSGYYTKTETYSDKMQSETEKFTDLSLSNSMYTADELTKNKDGLSFGEIFCDTFTFVNSEHSDSVNLNCKIEYVIESSHSKSDNSELLDKLWLYEEEIIKERETELPSAEKLNGLYLELSETSEELQKIALKDAFVDVTVVFADGSQQTKRLIMGLTQTEDSGLWLTVSEK